MTTTLTSCIGLKSPAVSKFREPYGLCCAKSSANGFVIGSNNCKNNLDIYTVGNELNGDIGPPPPPPPPIKGALPSKRLETQNLSEAPACVQNAMMTKDKKPFTYTPGGIDLSQIKSPRMAKRVQKNALSEGVTGPPKVSPLAQANQTGQPSQPPAAMARDMMGVPFQVFPAGPPAPPPLPHKQPAPSRDVSSQNGARRRSPQPQNFEPPPMGCRPEIKIPQNPMAALKPTPRPQISDDYWIDEYKNDKAAEQVLGPAPVSMPSPQPVSTPQSPQKPYVEPVTVSNKRPQMQENENKTTATQQKQQVSPQNKKNHQAQLESLYIPPAGETADKQLLNQLSPPWMSSKQQPKESAEWTHRAGGDGERLIPIQLERTPTKTPVTPSMGPQPFYGAKTPTGGYETPNYNLSSANTTQGFSPSTQYNPNHFVNQGYQNVDFQRMNLPQQSASTTRIIPIKIEGAGSPVTPPQYRGPSMQSPVVVQSDPRTLQQQTSWSNGAPNQSRSFRVLQKICDGYGDAPDMTDNVQMQYQQPQYSKPMSPGSQPSGFDETESNMRRMKLNDDDQQFMNRVRSQGPSNARPRGRPGGNRQDPDEDDGPPKPYVPPSEQQVYEPKKYTGGNIPSRSFRLFQAMTQPENAGPGQSDM
jgi:hypothetical protein